MVALGALLNNLFSQTTNWLNNQQRSDLSLPELCEQLLSNQGEVTGLSLARDILDQFEQQNSEGQKAFLSIIHSRGCNNFDLWPLCSCFSKRLSDFTGCWKRNGALDGLWRFV